MYLVVGASGRAIAESAARTGHLVLTIDYFGDRDTRSWGLALGLRTDLGLKPAVKNLLEVAQRLVETPALLSRWSRQLKPQGIKVKQLEPVQVEGAGKSSSADGASCLEGLILASGLENQPQALKWWEKRGLIVGNPVTALEKARDPWVLRATLAQIGVKMPPFWAAEEWKSGTLLSEKGKKGEQWLVKPLTRGGGHGIRFLAPDPKAAEAQIASLAEPGNFVVQKFIPGISASATFLADGQRAVLLGTSQQIIGAPEFGARPFAYTGNLVPWRQPSPRWQLALEHIAIHLTQALGLKGLNTVDFIANRRGIWVLELNPRWSASVELIEAWRQKQLFPCHLAACQKRLDLNSLDQARRAEYPAAPSRQGFWGKAIVYARQQLEVQETGLTLEDLCKLGLRDIPVPGTMILPGEPICTVLAQGTSEWMCRQNLQARAEQARTIMGEKPGGDAIVHTKRHLSYGSDL